MFGKQELNELQLRRQTLLLQSEMNRLTLQVELDQLLEAGNWLGKLEKLRPKFNKWTAILASVTGLLVMVGFRGAAVKLGSLSKLIAVAAPLFQLWRKFRNSRQQSISNG